ncbi:UNVERIFIED_CONTAM: hypothetical protein HDU68_011065 [Siphonaria sp. JEL0065]|nr:hypothetical protein HDU68_011065 [Siphonaria sp. JEL0065]
MESHATKRSRNTKYDGMDEVSSGSEHEPDHGDDGSPISATAGDAEKSRKKPGRKQVNTKPADKRTAQNRIAQRLFRERKQNYVKELEQKVDELNAIISGNPQLSSAGELFTLKKRVSDLEQENQSLKQSPAFLFKSGQSNNDMDIQQTSALQQCVSCASEKRKVQEYAAKNQELELKVYGLQAECNNLRIALSLFDQSNVLLSPSFQSPSTLMSLNRDFLGGVPSTQQQPQQQAIPEIPLPQRSPLQQPYTPPPYVQQQQLLQQQQQQQQQRNANFDDYRSAGSNSSTTGQTLDIAESQTVSASPRSDDWYDVARNGEILVPAVELFGPIQVEAQRFALKCIPALHDSGKYIDQLMDVLVALSKCASRKANKKLMVRLFAVKHRIMDACKHVMERQQVIEIFELFRTQHRNHMNHFYQNLLIGRPDSLASLPPNEQQQRVLAILKPFNEAVKALPSMKSSSNLIDEMCFEFSTMSLLRDESQREEKFVYMMGLTGQVHAICQTEEERTKFMLAMEIARERTRKYMDEYGYSESNPKVVE